MPCGGPDLTFLYNDAHRCTTLGVKHPWALGRPARDVWAEIWSEIKRRIDSALQSGEATCDEALLLFLEASPSGGLWPVLTALVCFNAP